MPQRRRSVEQCVECCIGHVVQFPRLALAVSWQKKLHNLYQVYLHVLNGIIHKPNCSNFQQDSEHIHGLRITESPQQLQLVPCWCIPPVFI